MEPLIEDSLTRVLREAPRRDADLRTACEEALSESFCGRHTVCNVHHGALNSLSLLLQTSERLRHARVVLPDHHRGVVRQDASQSIAAMAI